MKRCVTIILGIGLLTGCDTQSRRLEAIAELEAHCALPANSIHRGAADNKADKTAVVSVPDDGRRERHEILLIRLGTTSDQRVLEKIECVQRFKSRAGYSFSLNAVAPTEI